MFWNSWVIHQLWEYTSVISLSDIPEGEHKLKNSSLYRSGNFISFNCLDIKSFLMSCNSTDLLLVVVLPSIPLKRSKLKNQKLVTGLWSIVTSLRCKCILGEITCFPYRASTDLQNLSISPSAMSKSVLEITDWQKYLHASIYVCQHLKFSSGKIPLRQ